MLNMRFLSIIGLVTICVVANATDLISVFEEGKQLFKRETGKEWSLQSVDAFDIVGEKEFSEFVLLFNKTYQDKREYQQRLLNFQVNHLLAKAHQAEDQGTAKYGITKFSDLSHQEFKAFYRNLQVQNLVLPTKLAQSPVALADEFDWRKKGVIGPVKNQQQCGSCWTFSATGNIESHWAIRFGKMLSLSEQQLLDCDSTCYGCQGGWPTKAFDYVHQAGGIMTEAAYPYYAYQYACQVGPQSKFVAYVNGSTRIASNENDMAGFIVHSGPISILINAVTLQYYQGGVANPTNTQCNPQALDHAVLAVGYGLDEYWTPYWIVKNSWGPDWGEQGYWRVVRGSNACGIASTPTSSVIY